MLSAFGLRRSAMASGSGFVDHRRFVGRVGVVARHLSSFDPHIIQRPQSMTGDDHSVVRHSSRALPNIAACSFMIGAASGILLQQCNPRKMRTRRLATVACSERHPVTGLPPGPYPVGVTTLQLDDHSRADPDGGPRSLQTEIWYPATDDALNQPSNLYSDFLARGASQEYIERAEDPDAIGGYRDGLTIKELDESWKNLGKRDAQVRPPVDGQKWPVVLFSHGSGAFRASYVYFTEFLASQGFVVVACDHAGSSRYTILNGKVIKGGGPRSDASQKDRPLDMLFLLDCIERMSNGADSRFAGRVDATRCAVTGMSFGGWTAAKVADMSDARIKAAVLQCPSLARGEISRPAQIPILVQVGAEDTVIGEKGIGMCRDYFAQAEGPRYLVEIKAGGHVSFTSCEQYNPKYGNGIGPSRSLTAPGTMYEPLGIDEVHALVNYYTLAFLDVHLRGNLDRMPDLERNHYEGSIDYGFHHGK